MPDTSTYRPAPGTIPDSPGVYKFRDPDGRVIYVGKAKSLRSRLNSYFADQAGLHPRTRRMVTTAAAVEWTVVTTEVEALQLEYNWIKEFDPRFNVRYRDDKSYPELAVTLGEEFPRLQVMRGPHRKGVRYFGPYAHAWAIRETLDLLLRVFPARTCSAGVFRRSTQVGRPCLLGYIGKCSAPCVGRVTPAEHRDIVEEFCDFMAGRADPLIRRLDRQMAEAAAELDFEKAARLRDDVGALRRAVEKQAVVLGDGTDADVIGLAADELLASVQMFHVRGGRVRGQRGWIVDVDEETASASSNRDGAARLMENFLTQFYGNLATEERGDAGAGGSAIPREILVPALPGDAEDVSQWLAGLRGSRVSLRVAQRGDKRALAETVERNAAEALALHRLKRASDLTARSAALAEIAATLGMDTAPLRIECIDISHVQGTDVVASLVVFEDGLAKRSDYRRFAIRDRPGDDVASIAEVVRRRFSRGRTESARTGAADGTELADVGRRGIDPLTGRPRRFAYPPQLLVVDGGAPQVNAAAAVLIDLQIADVAVCGLAKRLEEVWVPGQDDPVIFGRTSEALYLLQRLRDEAHRFAITYHRSKRSKSMIVSALDGVPGLGPTRRVTLVRHFGSVGALRQADAAAIAAVPGFGPRLAATVHAALHDDPIADPPGPATRGRRHGRIIENRNAVRPVGADRGEREGIAVPEPDPRPDGVGPSVSGPSGIEVAIVSGLSGAGRSTAAKCLEDLGWFVVDNLPAELIATMVDLGSRAQGGLTRIAVVLDVRSRVFTSDLAAVIRDLDARGYRPRVLFLEATDAALIRRFEANRRAHPLQANGRIADGLAAERNLLAALRQEADAIIDTTDLSVHQLRAEVERNFTGDEGPRRSSLTVLSFGYKYGLPLDADLVVDVRFLPNPFWIPELRDLTGRDRAVSDYVLSQEGAGEFLDRYIDLLHLVGAGYQREGKRYLTLAVGCTGGKHRSVAMAEELGRRLATDAMSVHVVHRDAGRE